MASSAVAPCSPVAALLLAGNPGMNRLGWLALRLSGIDAPTPSMLERPETLPNSLPCMLFTSDAAGVGMKNEGGPLPGRAPGRAPGSLGMPGAAAAAPGRAPGSRDLPLVAGLLLAAAGAPGVAATPGMTAT